MPDTEKNAPDTLTKGHLLADMQEVDWRQALNSEQTLLRVAKPNTQISDALSERFCLDELHLKDIRNPAHPPLFTRLEAGALHIILRFPVDSAAEDKASDVTSVSILADARTCVLIWPDDRHHRFTNSDLAGLSVQECVCKIIHMLVDYLLQRVYVLREHMEEFEDECLADVSKADLGWLLQMRKELATLARLARANAIAIGKLKAEEIYHEDLRLTDAHEHMQRAASIAEAKSEHVLSVMQAVQSLLSQRLNNIMTFLAMITVVMTPLGIVAGIFGMNFAHMEILNATNGFLYTMLGMALMAGGLVAFFKLRKWW